MSFTALQVHPSGLKVFVVQTRDPNGPKRVTLGRYDDLTAGEVRNRATEVIGRIKRGLEPFPAPADPALVRLARIGTRREPARDRQAAWSHAGTDDDMFIIPISPCY